MYQVEIKKHAFKYISRLDKPTAKRIRDAIDKISEDPHIGERLTNHKASYKFRVGDYRILYDIYEERVLIIVIKVQGRGDVYNR